MKRRGFTLIELMVVIAIIIILAAIAIPNYLAMTARAKRSRVASDFAAIATALETYRTDWNIYPEIDSSGTIIVQDGSHKGASLGVLGAELAGPGTLKNVSSNVTAAGDTAPIEYMTTSILESMVNPYSSAAGDGYTYIGASDGSTWTLEAPTKVTTAGKQFLMRTNATPTVVDSAS